MSFKNRSKIVQLGDGSEVEVRTMRLLAARSLVSVVTAQLITVMKQGGILETLQGFRANPTEEGGASMLIAMADSMPSLIAGSMEASSHLLRNATELTPKQIDELYIDDALALISVALELNINEELKNYLAVIVRQGFALVTAKKQ